MPDYQYISTDRDFNVVNHGDSVDIELFKDFYDAVLIRIDSKNQVEYFEVDSYEWKPAHKSFD